jgi:hypothetical protein
MLLLYIDRYGTAITLNNQLPYLVLPVIRFGKKMSEGATSQLIGRQMVNNIIKGIQHLFKDSLDKKFLDIHKEIIIKKHDGDEMGDIDILLQAQEPLELKKILPQTHCKWNPDPAGKIFETLHIEVKRTCDSRTVAKNTNQFVNFYTNLCKEKCPVTGENHPILFIFNGADNIEVWRQIVSKAKGKTICGHPIYSVWVDSEALAQWELGMLNEKLEREKQELLEKVEIDRLEKQELLAQIDALMKKLNSKVEEV